MIVRYQTYREWADLTPIIISVFFVSNLFMCIISKILCDKVFLRLLPAKGAWPEEAFVCHRIAPTENYNDLYPIPELSH